MTEVAATEYRKALFTLLTMARMMRDVPIDDYLAAIAHLEAVGPIMDPTLWIERSAAMAEDKTLLVAAAPLVRWAREHLRDAP